MPFLSLYMTDDEVLGGVNFASGGAGLLNETGIYFVSYRYDASLLILSLKILTLLNCANIQVQYLSFDNQISSFEQIKNAMIAKIGKKAAEETVNGAIFQIGLGKKINASDSLTSVDARTQWHQLDTTRGLRCAGSNDYVNNFLRPFMADGIVYTHDEFIGLLMDTMDRQLTV